MTPGNLLFEYETALLVDSLTTRSFLIWSPSVKKRYLQQKSSKSPSSSLFITTAYQADTTYCLLLPTTYYRKPTTSYLQPTTCYLQPTTDYLLPTTYLRPTIYHLLSATTSHTRTTLSKVSTPTGSACFSTWRISMQRTTPVCFDWHTSQVHPIIFDTPLSTPVICCNRPWLNIARARSSHQTPCTFYEESYIKCCAFYHPNI